MKKHLVIYTYIILTFAWGIRHTQNNLAADVEYSTRDTGRVNLLCSYWYERFEPRKVLSWWAKTNGVPLTPDVIDKVAAFEYGRFCGVQYSAAGKDNLYILTAYENHLRGFNAQRLTPEPGFWNIYRIIKKEE